MTDNEIIAYKVFNGIFESINDIEIPAIDFDTRLYGFARKPSKVLIKGNLFKIIDTEVVNGSLISVTFECLRDKNRIELAASLIDTYMRPTKEYYTDDDEYEQINL